ncbi:MULTISPECIES: hypothetical protein [unclassified Luteimonas]|uniref:hypothetical protein n=1 Tax=unclassified Luteimonas TaxID=2629088 RepID=UPI0018F0BED1|nr:MULTISPECIES: hypothetical protein [unclassified Luteimonas]MBJ6982646.1 hypothetical protein [Luteimonas sp. MC1572]MBJ7574775.1 hypothetical protein [Luteimonas sp. MC1828]QQO03890.1 hypothetical protein JGR64_03760 [Luteimonas sp. MC1572]
MSQSNVWWRTILAVCLAATLAGICSTATPALKRVKASELGAEQRKDLETLIEDQVRERLELESSARMLNGLRLDRSENTVIVDLSAAFLPTGVNHVTAALEDRLHVIATGVLWLVENDLGLSLTGVHFTFDGKPLSWYYPDDYPDETAPSEHGTGLGPPDGATTTR